MKCLFTTLLIFTIVNYSSSQTIEKFSIDSGGSSTSAGGVQILYTIGEVAVAEYSASGVAISEGFINGVLSSTLGINDSVISLDNIKVFPNPTSDIINVLTEIELTKIEMYNVLGKRIFESAYFNKINVENFESGIYFLKLSNVNYSEVIRIVVK